MQTAAVKKRQSQQHTTVLQHQLDCAAPADAGMANTAEAVRSRYFSYTKRKLALNNQLLCCKDLEGAAVGTKQQVQLYVTAQSDDWDQDQYVRSCAAAHLRPANAGPETQPGSAAEAAAAAAGASHSITTSSPQQQQQQEEAADSTRLGPFTATAVLRKCDGKVVLSGLQHAGQLDPYLTSARPYEVRLQEQVGLVERDCSALARQRGMFSLDSSSGTSALASATACRTTPHCAGQAFVHCCYKIAVALQQEACRGNLTARHMAASVSAPAAAAHDGCAAVTIIVPAAPMRALLMLAVQTLNDRPSVVPVSVDVWVHAD
jgi:hypothetical protein